LDELAAAGVEAAQIYSENITGTRRDRPELNRMLADLRQGDTVIVLELSRLGRSTKDLMSLVDLIHQKGADFKSLNEAWIDTTTPQGKLIFTIFAGLCQFERDLTAERVRSGLKAAAARGRVGGRPSKQQEMSATVLGFYQSGMSKAAIARALEGVSLSTIKRIIAALGSAQDGES
jgi:DNA invertase Pin-like site-specific DNA recombinase